MTLDIDKDGPVVKQLLKPLNRDELKQLFEELGLSDTTLRNKYELDNVVYADDLIHAWMLGKDRVLEMGGVTKENMIIALKKIGQNGRAANFSTADRFGKLTSMCIIDVYMCQLNSNFCFTMQLAVFKQQAVTIVGL